MSSSSPPPHLSPPKLYTSAAIKSSPLLTKQIAHLVNSAFHRSREPSATVPESKWDNTRPRFASPDALHDMLHDERSVLAVIFDSSATTSSPSSSSSSSTNLGEESDEANPGLPIACAAAIPWAGGWHKEGAGSESGWEVKTVCVHEDAKYLHKGLAIQLLKFLEEYLVGVERQANGSEEDEEGKGKKVALWILAAECINGGYWRRRGYEEVRRSREGKGVWGCKTEFDMVVFRRKVEV